MPPNQDATKAAIEEGITDWLVQNARPDIFELFTESEICRKMLDRDWRES